ncbi:peptide chain release factor [Pseudosulfitobacter pseudonitzschiae]|uniref:Peptide chain release factor n=1 Tax=Pseudosulfitobacter pseudonitzschiae TaxID=1402135 RepID=A0A073J047_9RHOB|nr:peptide chain release factor H [Pseudosulfitobacter pseudonitzschiae]KEJ95988.1 peptide chain release factor [Pseudosulfitobacter pseudonitzschiae]QKS09852.1 peptide chain release factor H [Pseudosulfitobacter pseudonitzschiae]SHE93272.1 peptide chain release factor [Pseudosulfitobacter pseudonitzschiae]
MSNSTEVRLLITSGNGPGECQQAVAGVLQRMQDDADAAGLDLDASKTPTRHGLKSAVVVLHGAGAATFAARWCGSIQWRAKSTLRPHHKRANWFIGVFALKDAKTQGATIQPHEVTFESFRAGGPGGQHQNTTDSAVRATHRPTGLTATAREMRSQHRNKALAMERLHALMSAQAAADDEERKGDQNQLHNTLERGNPVRCFKGPAFREEGAGR